MADAIEPVVREITVEKSSSSASRYAEQRHNAGRVYEHPIEEHGYRGSKRTVRRLVASITVELGAHSKEVLLPLEFNYGQAFEAHWLEANVEMDGQLRKVYVLAVRLRASPTPF